LRRNRYFAGACAAIVISAAHAEPLAEARWLAPGKDRIAALTVSPGECLRRTENREGRYLSEVGRAAFSSPFLFGGQAARGGLSCASCHNDGHSNPDFFLEGLSGAPGTADVTSSIFSRIRDDGAFNPKPIPTLIGVGGKSTFGTAAPKPSLHAFIGSAVEDEFQGPAAPKAVLDGLVAYIERMDASACPASPIPLTPRRAMSDVERALAAAKTASARGDASTADFLLVSAQSALGRIHARFPGAPSDELRDALQRLSAEVGSMRELTADPKKLNSALDDSAKHAKRLSRRLEKARSQSLYDPERLRAYLGEE